MDCNLNELFIKRYIMEKLEDYIKPGTYKLKDEPKIRAMVAAAKPEPEDYYDEQREFNYYRR